MTLPSRSRSFRQFAIAFALEAALVVSWSAGFVGVRFAIDYAPVVSILLWRSAVSGVVLLPFALFVGPRMQGRDVFEQAGFGVLSMASYLSCYSLAIRYGAPTGIVALITDMLPLMVALLSWPLLRHKLSARQWMGTVLGIAGVLVASNATVSFGVAPGWVFALPVAGTAAFALGTLLLRHARSRDMPVHQQLCIQCLSAASAYLPFAWAQDGLWPVMTPALVGGILWLAFVATFGAWGLYYLALRRWSPARVTAVLYASPPLTLVWAWLVFDEPMNGSIIAGLVISLLGFAVFATSTPMPAAGTQGPSPPP
ncbi:MAG: DMT family transporter [Rhodoferax sp.]